MSSGVVAAVAIPRHTEGIETIFHYQNLTLLCFNGKKMLNILSDVLGFFRW